MPDIFVPIDTTLYEHQTNDLIAGNDLYSFAYNYYLQHKKQLEQYESAKDYVQQFNVKEMWDSLRQKWVGSKVVLNKTATTIQLQLKALLARFKWRNAGFYQVLNNDDPVLKKALEQLVK